MSAQSNVYLFNGAATFPIKIEGEVMLNSYPALKLAEYGNSILDAFYLDVWIELNDGTGNVGFVGAFKNIPSSLKYQMHAQARWFKERIALAGDSQAYIVLNDAGLNTLAYSSIQAVRSLIANRIVLSYFLRSAYYDTTSDFGVQIQLASGGNWFNYSANAIQAQHIESTIDRTFASDYENSELVNIRPYTINPEGTFYGAAFTANLLPPQFGFIFDRRATSCVVGSTVTLYMLKPDYNRLPNLTNDNQIGLNLFAYNDADRTSEASTGLYAVGNIQYQYSNGLGFTSMTVCSSGGGGTGNSVSINVQLHSDGSYSAVLNSNNSYAGSNTVHLHVGFKLNNSDVLGSFDFDITLSPNTKSVQKSDFYSPVDPASYDGIELGILSITGTGFNSTEVSKQISIS